MNIIEILNLNEEDLKNYKVSFHMATHRDEEGKVTAAIDIYIREGNLDNFAQWGGGKYFLNNRKFTITTTRIKPYKDKWLFVGIYENSNKRKDDEGNCYVDAKKTDQSKDLINKLVIEFELPNSQRYFYDLEEIKDKIKVVNGGLRGLKAFEDFMGFADETRFSDLKPYFEYENQSYRLAYMSVTGIYLIRDTKTHKVYVGKASGDGGLYSRFCAYLLGDDRTGGNQGFCELKEKLGKNYDPYINENFTITVLEHFHVPVKDDFLLKRESFWKRVFRSRENGFNCQ